MRKMLAPVLLLAVLLGLYFSSQDYGISQPYRIRVDSIKVDHKILLPVGGLQDATIVFDDLSPSLVTWIKGAGGGAGGGGYPPDGTTITLDIQTPDTFLQVGTIDGSNISASTIQYAHINETSFYTGLNANASVSSGALDFYPFDAADLTGTLTGFALPSNSPLGGGPINLTAGTTHAGPTWLWQTVYDSTAQPLIDSVEANDLTVTGDWIFNNGTTLSVFSNITFHAEGSVTFEEEPSLTTGDFVTSVDFADYLKDNFGSLPDSINKVRNNHLRTVSVNIDSVWINTSDKPLIWKFAQDITIDSVHVLMNPASVSSTLHFGIQLYHNANFATSGTAILADPMDVYNNGLGQGTGAFNDATVPAGNVLWAQFSSISNKTKGIMVTVYYSEDTANTAEGT